MGAMIMPKPFRVMGIVICVVMMLVPQLVCFTGASPRVMEVAHFISLRSPLTFFILVQVCIDEGRARERAARR
jgi:hypothetical protein